MSSYRVEENVDLVTFTKKILNGKLHFLCNVGAFCSKIKFVKWDSTLYTKFMKPCGLCDPIELE